MAHPVSHHHPQPGGARDVLSTDTVRLAKAASAGTTTNFRSLLVSSLQESGNNAGAHNARSSATGAYQFTERTWLDLVRRHGAALGHADDAAQITVKSGAPVVADVPTRTNILALRSDTPFAGALAARYFEENRAGLAHNLGRPPSENEVRMAFLLGRNGASRLIKAAHNQPTLAADHVVPSAVRHNPGLFRNHDGTVKTAGEAAVSLGRHFDAAMQRVNGAVGTHVSALLPSDVPVDDETV